MLMHRFIITLILLIHYRIINFYICLFTDYDMTTTEEQSLLRPFSAAIRNALPDEYQELLELARLKNGSIKEYMLKIDRFHLIMDALSKRAQNINDAAAQFQVFARFQFIEEYVRKRIDISKPSNFYFSAGI